MVLRKQFFRYYFNKKSKGSRGISILKKLSNSSLMSFQYVCITEPTHDMWLWSHILFLQQMEKQFLQQMLGNCFWTLYLKRGPKESHLHLPIKFFPTPIGIVCCVFHKTHRLIDTWYLMLFDTNCWEICIKYPSKPIESPLKISQYVCLVM